MPQVSIVVAVTHPAGFGNFQPSQLMFATGADFDEAFAMIMNGVARGARFEDALFLEPTSKGMLKASSALREMRRYGHPSETLVCPRCGSVDIRIARDGGDSERLTCERNCHDGGASRALFEGRASETP
jgi:hypothetical protein